MDIKLIENHHQLRLDELDSGETFQVKDSDCYYMATDEFEGETRLIVNLENGVITREKNELIILKRNDLMITNK